MEKNCVRRNVKWALSCVVFCLIVAALVMALGGVFKEKSSVANVLPIYDEDAKYDVVFLGTSHMVNGVYPMEIWDSHGITSVNYAQVGQPFGVTYYAAKEAVEVARPRLLVVDLYYVYMNSPLQGNNAFKHQSLDNMRPLSLNRLLAITEVTGKKEWPEFVFPFFAYHTRWSSLNANDFTEPDMTTKGAVQIFSRAEQTFEPFVPVDASEKLKPQAFTIGYIDQLMALSRETGTELLFTVIPYYPVGQEQGRDLADDQRMLNWVADYVEQAGFRCLNMLYAFDEIGFDPAQHMREWNHLNHWGGTLVSSYMADYIRQHYAIPDHRGEPGYEQWDADMAAYTLWRDAELAAAAEAEKAAE